MKKVILSHSFIEEPMERLNNSFDKVRVIHSAEPSDMVSELSDADGVIIRIGKVDRETMLNCTNLKVIGRPGVGVDTIDIEAATELGIPVVITPGANARSVAEHAMTFMFAVAKGLVKTDYETKRGNYSYRFENKSFELLGKNVFTIGFGNIGKEFAKMCLGIGMNVTVFDPYAKKEDVEALGFKYSEDIDKELPNMDVLSLHIPLTDQTKGIIGKEQFKMMKKTSIVLNCARGGIIDEKALAEALDNDEILGAGVDVYEVEPIGADYPLLKSKNLITTPHNAAITKEASLAMAFNCIDGVEAVLNGEKWPHVANKEVYDHPKWK